MIKFLTSLIGRKAGSSRTPQSEIVEVRKNLRAEMDKLKIALGEKGTKHAAD